MDSVEYLCAVLCCVVCVHMYMYVPLQRGVTSIASGEYAQGTIIEIEEPLPGEEYNPWQSITVLWDDEWSDLNLRSKVSTPEQLSELRHAVSASMDAWMSSCGCVGCYLCICKVWIRGGLWMVVVRA